MGDQILQTTNINREMLLAYDIKTMLELIRNRRKVFITYQLNLYFELNKPYPRK